MAEADRMVDGCADSGLRMGVLALVADLLNVCELVDAVAESVHTLELDEMVEEVCQQTNGPNRCQNCTFSDGGKANCSLAE